MMIIGNKSDLEGRREVQTEAAINFAREHSVAFLETSALNSNNVNTAFEQLVTGIYPYYVITPF